MSRGINKVTLIGNLGQDPELRYLANNDAIATFSVATSETWTDKKTKELRERTEWHRIVIYGKLAEICKEYAKQGTQVYIEGQLRTKKWTDNSGIDRYTTEVQLTPMSGIFYVLSGGVKKGEFNASNAPQQDFKGKSSPDYQPNKNTPPAPPMDFDDDIPF